MQGTPTFHAEVVALAQRAAPRLSAGPKLRPYEIRIGQRGAPRLSFGAMAVDSIAAVDQHLCLAERGERVEAIPVRADSFPVNAARHQLAEAQLRAVDQRRGWQR